MIEDDGWSGRAEQAPLLDEASTSYPKKKKRRDRKPKERCKADPNGHVHEWMKDTEAVPVMEYSYGYSSMWDYHSRQVGTKDVLYRLCVHCGKTQYKGKGKFGRWQARAPHLTAYRWKGRRHIS